MFLKWPSISTSGRFSASSSSSLDFAPGLKFLNSITSPPLNPINKWPSSLSDNAVTLQSKEVIDFMSLISNDYTAFISLNLGFYGSNANAQI